MYVTANVALAVLAAAIELGSGAAAPAPAPPPTAAPTAAPAGAQQAVPPWRQPAAPAALAAPSALPAPAAPAAPQPSVDWYKPTSLDERVPWNGNVFSSPFDSWRDWRSIGVAKLTRTISMPETKMEELYGSATPLTVSGADLELSTTGVALDIKPAGFFFGTGTVTARGNRGSKMDLMTLGASLGFPTGPRFDLGIPDVQLGLILPDAYVSFSWGKEAIASDDFSRYLLSAGVRVTGARLTVLDCLVAEFRVGVLAFDAEFLSLTTPDPADATLTIDYDGSRTKMGIRADPEFRVGVLF